jgi:threonine aldolase
MAQILGKESAVWCPTGTLANHLGVRLLAGGKRRVLVQSESHLYNDEGDCAQTLSGLNLVPMTMMGLRDVKEQVERAAGSRVELAVGAISIESPIRRKSGEVVAFEEMKEICSFARAHGVGTHLDGARLFIGSAYTGVSVRDYSSLFDTVYVSMYKYFNAASGAILAGPRKMMENLYHTRRMFGGGMNQSWPNAAVALHFANGFEERYRKAVEASEELYKRLGDRLERVKNGSNIAWWKADEGARRRLAAAGILVAAPEGGRIGLRVNESAGRRTAGELWEAFSKA